jgi:3-dehydroquinate synthase class II
VPFRVSKTRNKRFLVDARDWSIIPAENIIASASDGTEIIFYATSPQHMSSLLGALEAGVHGVVLKSDDLHQVCWRLQCRPLSAPKQLFCGGVKC